MARHARLEAPNLRIAIQPIGEILLLSYRRPWLIRDLIAFDDAEIRRNPANCAQRDDRSCQDRNVGIHTRLTHHGARPVRQQVPVGTIVSLPDPAEIRFSVRPPRYRGARILSQHDRARFLNQARCRQPDSADHDGCHQRNQRLSFKTTHRIHPLNALQRYFSGCGEAVIQRPLARSCTSDQPGLLRRRSRYPWFADWGPFPP